MDEYRHSTIPQVLRSARTYCPTSNHTVVTSRPLNQDATENSTSRGIKKQKYPLDDYLINKNTQARTHALLPSLPSPVASPETMDVLQNAEKLVRSAQKQIMEVSFNSTLNVLDENPLREQQPLDESLLYVREMVASKFQESNDPTMNNLPNLNKILQHDHFPVKESSGMLNKPLEISEQNSDVSASQRGKGIFLQTQKPFFKEASDWFNIRPPKHLPIFPTSTAYNLGSKTKSSCTVPCCKMTNTGVIEIDARDHVNGTIQVQTGPTVDIRSGLTIQTIESVHISPDPSSVPIHNNIATYCFQHEPSTQGSYADSNRIHNDKYSITNTSARNGFEPGKEIYIRSTDYNDMDKVVHIENADNAISNDMIHSDHEINQNTQGMPAKLTNNTNHQDNSNNNKMNSNEIDGSISQNNNPSGHNVIEGRSNMHKSLIGNESQLQAQKSSQESANNLTHLKKGVGINSTPIITSVYQELSIAEGEVNTEHAKVSKHEISSDRKFANSYSGQKFHKVLSDKDHVERLHVCGDECKIGSCSRKCERDVEYREKQKLKQALETIANIEKIRFDIRDTGIVPAECTQMCEDKNHCNADTVDLVLEPPSDSERFKVALEDLCKFSLNTEASKVDTNSKIYQEAIDCFVKMVFDSNNQSDKASRQNNQSVGCSTAEFSTETTGFEAKKGKAAMPPKQIKLYPKTKEMEYHQQTDEIVKPVINNIAVSNLSNKMKVNTLVTPIEQFHTSRIKEPSKPTKPLALQNLQLPKHKAAQEKKIQQELIPNVEANSMANLDLKKPCISDVDAVLKTYCESMAAIRQGTTQLSQLISHHIMKNTLLTSDHISSPSIPHCPIVLGETDVDPDAAINKTSSAKSLLNFVPCGSSTIGKQLLSSYQEKSTDQTSTQAIYPKQIQSRNIMQRKQGRIPQVDYTNASKDNAEFSNENNSGCTNETPTSITNEYLSTCSENPQDQAKSSSNTDKKSSPVQSNLENNTSNSTSSSRTCKQTSVNVRRQSVPTQHRVVKSVRKSDEKQFMNIQYCVAEPFQAPIPIEVELDKQIPLPQSDLKSSLNAYLHLENACGKDVQLRRHSNYDIRSDQAGDFDSYRYPVLISGHIDNLQTSNNNCNDHIAPETIIQNKEVELQVFEKILDTIKNSSKLMKQVVTPLFDEMEIDSINDVLRNLEDAAVHPIVTGQLLSKLENKITDKSSLEENLMLTNPLPVFDNRQKDSNELAGLPQTRDNIKKFKDSIELKDSLEITNIRDNEAVQDAAVLHPVGDPIARSSESTQLKMNLNLEFDEDSAHSSHNCNNPGNKTLENKLKSHQIQYQPIFNNRNKAEELMNNGVDLAISEGNSEAKSHLLKPLLTSPNDSFQVSAEENMFQSESKQNCIEGKQKSLNTEHCQSDLSNRQVNINESLINTTSSNVTSKKNDSKSNTDIDISFIIPHDADINNEAVDLSSVPKLTSVSLKNEGTGDIAMQIQSTCTNCLRLNNHPHEQNVRMNSNSDPGQSSITTNNNSRNLQNSNEQKLNENETSLTKNPQNGAQNIICHCKKSKNQNDLRVQSYPVPCESSLDTINALIDSQIQSNYKQLGLMDSEGKAAYCTPDKMNFINQRTLNARPKLSQQCASSKSPTRNDIYPRKSVGKTKKSFDMKMSQDKKEFPHSIQAARVKKTGKSDSDESNITNACPLCIQLQGNCSCTDCINCNANSKKQRKSSPIPKKEKKKPIKNTVSPRQNSSPKHSGNTTGKNVLRRELNTTSKELSSQLTPEYGKNAECKNIDHRQRILKNDKKFIGTGTVKDTTSMARKSKRRPTSGILTKHSNHNGLLNRKVKSRKNEKLLQGTTVESNNLKVEDKSQNTAKYEDVVISCKSTKTRDTSDTSSKDTVCKHANILCEEVTDETALSLPTKLNKTVQTITVDKPSLKQTSTLSCLGSISAVQISSADLKNTCCDRMIINKPKILECTKIKKFSTISSQTSQACNNYHKDQPNSLEVISQPGTVSVFEKMRLNIFDDESIIVLKPLNELDHTFFIAKPNCVERKIIKEKLDEHVNVQLREMTQHACSSIHEMNKHHKKTDMEPPFNSNGVIAEHVRRIDESNSEDFIRLNSGTSAISCIENKECEAGCSDSSGYKNLISDKHSDVEFFSTHVTGPDFSILPNQKECADLCTNDDECLRICSQTKPILNDSRPGCNQDCPQEEICLKLCPPIPTERPLLATSSININGILKKFIAENSVSNVKMPIVKGLLQELKKVEDSLRVANDSTKIEKSEPDNDADNAKTKDAPKLVEEANQRYNPDGSNRKSVQYEEPPEKMGHIMRNRKSTNLPNIVRGVADMHPSKRLDHLKLRAPDPLISGNFNKPESDKRYSVFNQSDPMNSSIDLKDPRTQAHLSSVAQWARAHEGEKSSSESSVDILQATLAKISKTMSKTGKSKSNKASKLNKSRRGMDADFDFLVEHDQDHTSVDSMKSFESSDLEPGQLLQVRTPCDNPIKSINRIETVPRNQTKKTSKAENSAISMGESSFSRVKLLTSEKIERHTATENSKATEINNSHNLKAGRDLNDIINENDNIHPLHKYSEQYQTDTSDSNSRSQIINYFLGKTKLENMEIDYTNNKTALISEVHKNFQGNCQQVYFKSGLTLKTIPVSKNNITLESQDIFMPLNIATQINFSAGTYTERYFRNSNQAIERNWDQTSSDTYSEGEINLPSSCSYSLGEIKLSTPSSTTAAKSFKDPDGFTVIVTKSILDSTQAMCTSPGEILADIQRTETDASSSIS